MIDPQILRNERKYTEAGNVYAELANTLAKQGDFVNAKKNLALATECFRLSGKPVFLLVTYKEKMPDFKRVSVMTKPKRWLDKTAADFDTVVCVK